MIRNYIAYWRICRKQGHDYRFEQNGLTGDWIKCTNCYSLDEYIPGAHEPKGYDYAAVHGDKP